MGYSGTAQDHSEWQNGRDVLSNDPYARQYEADLLRELRADGVAGRVVALGAAEEAISVGAPATASNLALCFPYAVFAQTFAFLRSLSSGLRPDTPDARGIVPIESCQHRIDRLLESIAVRTFLGIDGGEYEDRLPV